jgi:O-antigen/teichoic acid export membrane protein
MKRISLSRNVMFGFISWLLPLGLTFALTPLIVHGLGAQDYGLYALVMGFIAYSFTFNVGRAITKYVAAYRASNQDERIGEVLSTTLMVNLLMGIISAVALAMAANVLVTRVLNIAPHLQANALLAFYLAAAGLLVTMLSQVFSAVPQAVHRFDIYSLVTTLTGMITIGGNGLLVWLGFGIKSLVAWCGIATALSCVAFFVASRRLLPEARLTFRFKKDLVSGILRFSGSVIAYQVLANLLLLFERGWLMRTLGSEAVTFYVVPMTIAIYIHAFISSLTLVIFPLASEAGAQQDTVRLYGIYTRAFKYISLMVVFIVITTAVGSWQLLANWMGVDFANHAAGVLATQAVVFGLMALLIVPWQIADGLGFPWANALLSLWWLLTTALLAIFLTPRMGIQGMAWSRLIGMLVVPIFILIVERHVFGRNLWEFWRRVGASLVLSGLLTGLAQHFMFKHLPFGWLWFLLTIVTSGLLFGAMLLLTRYMDNEEQQWLRSFFAKIQSSNA